MTANEMRARLRIAKAARSDAGFTMIETAIALVVLMVAALAITSLFAFAINYNSDANDRAMALAVAQQQLEQLRKSPISDASLNTASLTTTATSGGRQYSVVTTICSTSDCGGSATIKIITIQVTPQGAVKTWARGPVTIVSQRAAPLPGPYLQ